jgi:alpha-mannosidase
MYFTLEKIEKRLAEVQAAIRRDARRIPAFKFIAGSLAELAQGAEAPDFDDREWHDFHVGDFWGGYDVWAWFRAWVSIPKEWQAEKLALRFLPGPRDGGGSTAESLLYVNGSPLQGIDVWHPEAWLPPEMAAGGRVLVALKSWSGVLKVPDRRRFKEAALVRLDPDAERYYYRASNMLKSAKLLDENDLRRVKMIDLLDRSLRCIDFSLPGSPEFYASLGYASHFLEDGLMLLQTHEIKPRLTAVGHSHLDLAWLWRVEHTRHKAARTFATVLHLMSQYPEYRYLHSSPQLYKWMKTDYPELYQRVRQAVREGRWEISGGMWVEADANLPSGESLIRQILFGKRFVRDEFGVEMNVLWLPDVFGYPASMPQIIRKCGLKYFLTSKLSWSQFNRFPYDTFYWKGIDGSQALTHFITTPDDETGFYTYNGRLEPSEVKGAWDNYRQKNVNDELLYLYGWGDGGGGPTHEMLEAARCLSDLPGTPSVEMGGAEAFFERLERRLAGRELPEWDGELYLEYHRGTYTSQAFIKRLNRRAERLYHEAEWLSACADALVEPGSYPEHELRQGWELILLNQFHDILPGSSIREVYEDSRADYERLFKTGQSACRAAQDRLLAEIGSHAPALVVFNGLCWPRSGWVEIPEAEAALLGHGLTALPYQAVDTPGGPAVLFETSAVPGLGYWSSYDSSLNIPSFDAPACQTSAKDDLANHDLALPSPGSAPVVCGEEGQMNEMLVAPHIMENGCVRLELDAQGQLVSIYDKRCDREVLAPGERGNLLQAFEDKPLNYDAWDIDIYYQEKARQVVDLQEAVVEESGPLRGTLRLVWRFGRSTITQRVTLHRGSPRIDFRTHIDWQEQQVLLKAAFPVDIRSTRATYDIQFGCVERPTHWNTSWDYARFEVPAHKWVDLSEGGYGVALLNDCKYGYDVRGNLLRITLLKSALNPDPTADQGEHVFTYSLLPHLGDWREGRVVQAAYELNNPLEARLKPANRQGSLPVQMGFVSTRADHIVIETLKKAEDERAWIVRVYEFQQRRSSRVSLDFALPLNRAVECNLVEEAERPAVWQANNLEFSILPFEIKTFKVWF